MSNGLRHLAERPIGVGLSNWLFVLAGSHYIIYIWIRSNKIRYCISSLEKQYFYKKFFFIIVLDD